MAEYSTPEERTEMPTDRRMEQFRKEGAIYMSNDVVVVASLASGFLALYFVWGWFFSSFKILFVEAFKKIGDGEPLTPSYIMKGLIDLAILLGPQVAVVVVTVSIVASLAVLFQTKWNVKEKKIHFKFSYLNPITGIKRIFSIHGFMNTLKAFLKLALIIPIAYFAMRDEVAKMILLIHMNLEQVLTFTGIEMWRLFWRILYVLIALAVFDWVWGKYQWLRTNKMTKDEVKDERKAIEGDETTKRRIIAKGLQRIIQRISKSVPQADVVITNPTHISVALKYDRKTMRAPTVVAKGKGFVAQRIREIAKESQVPIVERKPLARALYDSCEVGAQIPHELYKAVAEILAYVYRLKRPWQYAQSSAST